MKVQEALDHKWTKGEKLWEVYYKLNHDITTHNGSFCTHEPVGIIEVTVKKVELHEYFSFKSINLDLTGDWKLGDDNAYPNTVLCGMINYQSTGNFYSNQRFCTDKFFNKEDAEKRFKKVVEQWNKKVKAFQESQKTKLEEAKKQYEVLLNKGLIDIEKNTINI